VAAAARALNMHRSTVHRYLTRHPDLRTKSGKVSTARLIATIEAEKRIEPRGRALKARPKKPPRWRLSRQPFKFAKFNARIEDWSREDALDWLYEYERASLWTEKLRAKFGLRGVFK